LYDGEEYSHCPKANERLGESAYEGPEANKLRKKQRIDGYNNDTSDASGDFSIVDLIDDSEEDEEDLYEGEDPYLFIIDSEIESDTI
jgi:hypothetical protein